METNPSKVPLTDILAEAASAQFRAADFMGPGVVRGIAPAKVNLFLGVGTPRADGRHEVVNVMQALALHDVLYVNARPFAAGEEAELKTAIEAGACDHAFAGPGLQGAVTVQMVDKMSGFGEVSLCEAGALPARENLAYKAVHALACALERDVSERVLIRIEKQIPSQAGLGGGSSDAACVLACLAKLWGVTDEGLLLEVAASLGADVPFFLQGGCALYEGAGEAFVRTLDPLRTPVLIVKPHTGVSTATAYAAFDEAPVHASADCLAQVRSAHDAAAISLFNGLTKAACALNPEAARVREWLCVQEGIDAERMLLSGSGSAFFAEVASFDVASKLATTAKRAGFWARPTAFSPLRAQVV